jgi:hypothetical protein
MGNWMNADDGDKVLFTALSLLYGKNEKLLHLILNPDSPCLISTSESIKKESLALSPEEQLLIRIGLDAWNGSGGLHFNEIYQKLGPLSFQKVLLFLNYLYSPQKAILF